MDHEFLYNLIVQHRKKNNPREHMTHEEDNISLNPLMLGNVAFFINLLTILGEWIWEI